MDLSIHFYFLVKNFQVPKEPSTAPSQHTFTTPHTLSHSPGTAPAWQQHCATVTAPCRHYINDRSTPHAMKPPGLPRAQPGIDNGGGQRRRGVTLPPGVCGARVVHRLWVVYVMA